MYLQSQLDGFATRCRVGEPGRAQCFRWSDDGPRSVCVWAMLLARRYVALESSSLYRWLRSLGNRGQLCIDDTSLWFYASSSWLS